MHPLRLTLDRICGRADLEVHWHKDGSHQAWLRMPELRGFESILCGRPAEEIPHLASRISAICPWPHHIAAVTAVEAALQVEVPPTALLVRELGLLLSSLSDRLLLFYVLNAPDVLPGQNPEERSFFNLMHVPPVRKALLMRTRLQRLLTPLAGQALHAGSMVVGGLSRPLAPELLTLIRTHMQEIRRFCQSVMAFGRKQAMPDLLRHVGELDKLSLPMLGSVDDAGNLALWGGHLRYVQPDGSHTDYSSADFLGNLTEEYAQWTRCAFPRLSDGPAVSLDSQNPQGMYRVGPLARINACERIATPKAQEALESFRREMGRHPQQTVLYHWARLIEMIHCCERAEDILDDPQLLGTEVRAELITACAGQGMARVEAPRGTLFYSLELDGEGMVRHCRIISPTTQNNAAMNVSLTRAARALWPDGPPDDPARPAPEALHKLTQCLRAYDPCPACAVHMLRARPVQPARKPL